MGQLYNLLLLYHLNWEIRNVYLNNQKGSYRTTTAISYFLNEVYDNSLFVWVIFIALSETGADFMFATITEDKIDSVITIVQSARSLEKTIYRFLCASHGHGNYFPGQNYHFPGRSIQDLKVINQDTFSQAILFPNVVKFKDISRTWKVKLFFSRFSRTRGNPVSFRRLVRVSM